MKFNQLTFDEKCMYITYMVGKVTIIFTVLFIIACLN